jgi:flagellar protein FlbD
VEEYDKLSYIFGLGTENNHKLLKVWHDCQKIMVKLTRLNKTILIVNAELIEFIEATPDTIVTLTTGRKVVVRETVEDVIERVVSYKRSFMQHGPSVLNRQ